MLGHITYLSDDVMADKFGRGCVPGNSATAMTSSSRLSPICAIRATNSPPTRRNTYLLMTKALTISTQRTISAAT